MGLIKYKAYGYTNLTNKYTQNKRDRFLFLLLD